MNMVQSAPQGRWSAVLDDELFLGALFVDSCQISKEDKFMTELVINGKCVTFKIDTGADGNVILEDMSSLLAKVKVGKSHLYPPSSLI